MTERRTSTNTYSRAALSAPPPSDRPAKVTLVMLRRHVLYMDDTRMRMRRRYERAMPRGTIVRGLIEFMEVSGIDFSLSSTAAELTRVLTAYFVQLHGEHTARLEATNAAVK